MIPNPVACTGVRLHLGAACRERPFLRERKCPSSGKDIQKCGNVECKLLTDLRLVYKRRAEKHPFPRWPYLKGGQDSR